MLNSLNNSGLHIKEHVILVGNKLTDDDKISVYPNPASKSFYLQINSNISDSIYVEIINAMGQLLTSFQRNINSGTQQINVNEATGIQLKPGIYNVRISKRKIVTQLRIVISG